MGRIGHPTRVSPLITQLREVGPARGDIRLLLAILVLSLAMGGTWHWHGQIHAHEIPAAGHWHADLLLDVEPAAGSPTHDAAQNLLHVHHLPAPVLISGPDAPLGESLDFLSGPIDDDDSIPPPSSTLGTPHRPPIV